MNKTNIPPKKIKNKIYENQNLSNIIPVIKQIKIVWINSMNPIANGCFNWENIIVNNINNIYIIVWII